MGLMMLAVNLDYSEEDIEEEDLKEVTGDDAYYVKHVDGKLVGGMVTHVDNFMLSGTTEFIDSVTKKIQKSLTVSKVED